MGNSVNRLIFVPSMRFWFAITVIGFVINSANTQPAVAEVESKESKREIIELGEFEFPVTNVNGLLSQSSTPSNLPSQEFPTNN